MSATLRTYVLYMAVAIVAVLTVGITQHVLVLKIPFAEIRYYMLLLPIMVGAVFGFLIATIRVLQQRQQRQLQLIREHQQVLEQQVDARKRMEKRLRHQSNELLMANRELESFGYSVSHDLRGPLRRINGFSDAVAEDCGEALDDNCRDFLHRIRESCVVMGEMIDGLQALSKITRAELQPSDVDLSGLAANVLDELVRSEPGRHVEVRVAPGIVAQGDPKLLRLALHNLLGNAWKFTVGTEHPVIEFGAIDRDGETQYFVRDNGAGFDPHYADRLFRAFQRLHDSKEYEGTGVGLATVMRVIRRHGGDIRGEGEPGKGATFYFTLAQSE